MKTLSNKFILTCSLITITFSIWLAGNLGAFDQNKIYYDVICYHSYTPALFIKKDLSLRFYKDSSEYYNNRGMYWANFTPDKKPILKTTYGLSLMYLPFTVWPILFDSNNTLNGYELPFSIAISISSIIYFILSVFFLFKLLKELRFSNLSIGLVILSVGLGTNLLSFVSISIGSAHSYNFFLLTVLLYSIVKWHQSPTISTTILIGFLFGLLVLIRPTNIIFSLVFILFNNSKFTDSFGIYLKKWKLMLLMAITAFIVILPQLIYWKYVTGHFFFNSYVGERFYFNNPHILEYLIGFRKGWFIYTPMIIIGLIGLFYYKNKNPFLISTLIIIPLLIFLNSSWWCWWFGGGHGARGMIECYPLIAIGFASFFENFIPKWKKITISITIYLILLNLKSVDLSRSNIYHYDSMTFEAYKYTLFKIFYSPEEKNYLKTLYKAPDYNKALKGEDT